LLFELAQNLGVDRIHSGFGMRLWKREKGGVVRSWLAKGQAQKGYEGQPIVDLVFQLGVRELRLSYF
jgi:hypothetical protein